VRLYDWRAERLTTYMGGLWHQVQYVHGVMDSWRHGGIC